MNTSIPSRPVKKVVRIPRSLDILNSVSINLEEAYENFELYDAWFHYKDEKFMYQYKRIYRRFKDLRTSQIECPCCKKNFTSDDYVYGLKCCEVWFHENCFQHKKNNVCVKCLKPQYPNEFVRRSIELRKRFPGVDGFINEEYLL